MSMLYFSTSNELWASASAGTINFPSHFQSSCGPEILIWRCSPWCKGRSNWPEAVTQFASFISQEAEEKGGGRAGLEASLLPPCFQASRSTSSLRSPSIQSASRVVGNSVNRNYFLYHFNVHFRRFTSTFNLLNKKIKQKVKRILHHPHVNQLIEKRIRKKSCVTKAKVFTVLFHWNYFLEGEWYKSNKKLNNIKRVQLLEVLISMKTDGKKIIFFGALILWIIGISISIIFKVTKFY